MSNTPLAVPDRPATWCSRAILVTLQGPQGKHVHLIDKPFARVGAHPHSEIVLPDGPAKRFFLHASHTGIYCLSLEHNPLGRPSFNGWMSPRRAIAIGTYQVNARFADDSAADRGTSGDCEEMGTGTALVPIPGEGVSAHRSVHGTEPVPTSSHARPQLELTTVAGRRQTVQLRLRRPLTIVGREPPSKLCLADTSISRAHCILYWDDARLWAIDLFSANGIRIDGRPVEFGIVSPGSGLVLGNILLTHVSDAQGPSTQQGHPEPEQTDAPPSQAAAVGADTLVLSAQTTADNPAVDGTPVDETAGAERCQEPLAVAPLTTAERPDSQGSQTPSAATVDELRREAQRQSDEWVERSDALLAELARLRAELVAVEQERDSAQLQQRQAEERHQQAEQAQAEMSARLRDIELAHRDLELAHSALKDQLALKEQLAVALEREELQCQPIEESTVTRDPEGRDPEGRDPESRDPESRDPESSDPEDRDSDDRDSDDRDSEDRVAQGQLVVWQPERKLFIDELVRPPSGELSPAAIEIACDSTAATIENANDLLAEEIESANMDVLSPARIRAIFPFPKRRPTRPARMSCSTSWSARRCDTQGPKGGAGC